MAKRKKDIPQPSTIDMGTSEMARQFKIVPTYTSHTDRASRVMDGTEVDRMLLNDQLNINQHATLNLLARKMNSYGMGSIKSPDYAGRIMSDPQLVSERKAQALRGAVHLIDKLDKHPHVGKFRRKKLINLVMEDGEWGHLRHQLEELWACVSVLDDIFMGKH